SRRSNICGPHVGSIRAMTIRTQPPFALAPHTPLCADEATVFTVEALVRLGRALTLLRGLSGSAPFGPELSHDLRHGELSAFPCLLLAKHMPRSTLRAANLVKQP